MKLKTIVGIMLILLMVSIVSVAFNSVSATSSLSVVRTSASTDVSGRITTNTTWTLADSPYIIVGDVIVETNVFLTIEPGVVVKFTNGTNLIVDGALIARGNSTYTITFTSNAATPQLGDWGTIRFRDTSIDEACIIDWVTIEYASAGITIYNSSPKIDNSILRYNVYGFYSESEGIARISNSSILNNTYGIGGSFAYYYYYSPYTRSQISNSRILNNTYGVWSSGGTLRILASDISYNTNGIIASSATISKSIISNNNGSGVSPYWYRYDNTTYYYDGTFSITYSTITENKENGIVSKGSSNIHFSNLYNNTPYDAYNAAPFSWSYGDVDATNNWWGTTNTTKIDEHIYDYYDDYNLKRVFYQPSLNSSVTIPPIAHDVAIANVTASPTSVEQWQSVYITVNVINEGDFDENVTVTARYDSVQIGTWTYGYGLLPAGQSATASFYWYPWDNVPSGNYTISAEVNIVPGETDTADNVFINGQVEVIGPPPPPPQPPYAYFSYSPYYPSAGEPITFDASYSYDPDGYVVDYIWNYGDNTTGSGKVTNHIYNASGTYAVILRVTDDDGLNGTTINYVTILPPMLVHDIAITNVKASPPTAVPGELVSITVEIENQGDFNETFTVTVFYDNNVAAPAQNVINLMPKANTTLTFIWNTTGVALGEYAVRAEASVVAGEGDIGDNTFINGTVTVSRVAIDVKIDAGSIHFRGEMAEFYVLVSVLGESVDANISAILYYNNGTLYANLSAYVQNVKIGLYRIPYAIPTEAPTGTYALVVEASYLTLRGESLKSFLLSSALTGWNALLINIDETVGTIKTDVGLIEVKLDDINATLLSIEDRLATINSTIGLIQTDIATIQLKVTSINGTIATIQTTLGTIEGKITSIEEEIATIKTDVGTIKTMLEGWTGGTSATITTPAGSFQIFVLTTSTLEGQIAFSDNILALSLSGPSGTTGKTNIVIPKQLLVGLESSIDKVVVTIDDKQVVFTYTEQPENYLLQIAYTHSTHLIRIYLTGLPPTPFPAWIVLFIVLVVAVATGLAFYTLKIRKSRIPSDSKSTANLDS